jgi:methionine-rich copper-binding protein CopC
MRFRRSLFLAAALPLALAAAPAGAHAVLEASEPADGAVLATAPRQVMIRFNEPSRITSLRLVNESGQEVGGLRREPARTTPTAAAAAVTGPLAPGGYRVEWRAMGSDGHVMSGTVHFTVTSR